MSLTSREISVGLAATARSASHEPERVIGLRLATTNDLLWRGEEKLRGQTNYFIGRDSRAWRTRVPHFARVQATNAAPGVGVVVYGNDEGLEYDVRFAPGARVSQLRLRISGAERIRLGNDGDLLLRAGHAELRMKGPSFYEEWPDGRRQRLDGGYTLHADGSLGFRVGLRDPRATLVADPTLSVSYATFLGGSGTDAATSIALDKSGKIYVGGTTTSLASFPGLSSTLLGPASGPSAFFIAKIDPTIAGPNSLVYLTFLGGSGQQAGGLIAVDGSGNTAITGATTSADFPVTDSSHATTGLTQGGGNDVAISKLDPTGSTLVFSTLFGGSGAESQNGAGAIALDNSGNVYIASDTRTTSVNSSSPDLPVTTNAYQTSWGGQPSDGFLAVFQPPAASGGAPQLTYCSYLGTNSTGPVGVGGMAVDASAYAYIAGFTNNSSSAFPATPATGAFQASYGGGASDGFLMKISPGGQGQNDLIYATLLGGSGADQALGVALDSATPPNAYVTGVTQSTDFPVKGATPGYQSSLGANATSNAFFVVIAQNGATNATSLAYGTYLGGFGADVGQGVAVSAPNAVYLAGSTTSWSFPWRDNVQPLNGAGDAFVAKLDPTSAGAASLIYATPLGGTSPVGGQASATASAVAANGAGNAYVVGSTTAADFPTALTSAGALNGFQTSCASCALTPPASEAFVAVLHENPGTLSPSVYFNFGRVNFPVTAVANTADAQPVAVVNAGEAQLNISDISVTGPNAADFSLIGGSGCTSAPINPGLPPACSFEVSFTPSAAGPEGAFLSVTDNAPGSPHVLELTGAGTAVLEISPTSLNFGSVPLGSTSSPLVLSFTNTASSAVLNLVASVTGPDVANFPLLHAQGTNCNTIASGSQCQLQYGFEPQTFGALQAELYVTYDLGSDAQTPQVIPLSGIGTPTAPLATLSPPALTFGNQTTGTTSNPQAVVLSNTGSAPLDVTSISIVGNNPGDFSIQASGTTCPLSSGSVGFGSPPPSCTVAVQFAPQAAGSRSAKLRFSDNSAGSPQDVALSGTAKAPPPPLQVSFEGANFGLYGAQSEGIASNAQAATIENVGSTIADISGIALDPSNTPDFQLQNSCGPNLASNASCQLGVVFKPAVNTQPGDRSAALLIPNSNQPATPLFGTATQAAISLPTSFGFSPQPAGPPSSSTPAQPLTVTNSSSGPLAGALAVTGASISGTNSVDFLLANNGNGCSALTPPGKTCTIQLEFAPAQAASCDSGSARSASLDLTDNAPGSPHHVPLTGTAEDFCVDSASGQAVSATVSAGDTATYSLTVDSQQGYSGSVSLSCSDSVTLSDCTITTTPATSPPSVQVSANTPGQFSVSVTTTAATPVRFVRWRPGSPMREITRVALVSLLALLALWLLNQRSMRLGLDSGAWRKLAGLGVVLVALALLFGMAACGSGGDSPATAPPPGTPPGSYTVTVTATASNGASRTIQLGLTVD